MVETKAVIIAHNYSFKILIIFFPPILTKLEFSRQILVETSQSEVSAWAEWAHTDGPTYWKAESWTYTMKLIVAFPNFVNKTLCSVGREWNSSECNFTAQQHAEEVMKWHKYEEGSDVIEGAASDRL